MRTTEKGIFIYIQVRYILKKIHFIIKCHDSKPHTKPLAFLKLRF